MNIETRRLRNIQEAILRILAICFQGTADLPVLWRHVVEGFARAIVPYSEEEIRAAMTDLVERGLVNVSDEEGLGDMPEKGYRSTPAGRDFLRARCPWDLLDRFSGAAGTR
jgi:hypothetical protein